MRQSHERICAKILSLLLPFVFGRAACWCGLARWTLTLRVLAHRLALLLSCAEPGRTREARDIASAIEKGLAEKQTTGEVNIGIETAATGATGAGAGAGASAETSTSRPNSTKTANKTRRATVGRLLDVLGEDEAFGSVDQKENICGPC